MSYRRGCEALVSREHGLTWNLAERYVQDEFRVFRRFPAQPGMGPSLLNLSQQWLHPDCLWELPRQSGGLIRWRPL